MARINQEDVMISRYEFNEENRKKEENHGILYLFGEINTGAAAAVTKEIIEINRKNEREKSGVGVGSSEAASPFAEITEDDIDNLFR